MLQEKMIRIHTYLHDHIPKIHPIMLKEETTLLIVECTVGTEHINCFLNHSGVELTTIILYYCLFCPQS